MPSLRYINLCLASLLCPLLALLVFFPQSPDFIEPMRNTAKKTLPISPFKMSEQSYDAIGSDLFKLKWVAPSIELPDLRSEILFLGKNNRPDMGKNKGSVRLLLSKTGETKTVKIGEKVFIDAKEGAYFFSDTSSTCWITTEIKHNDSLHVTVSMKEESGALITTPDLFHSFSIEKTAEKNVAPTQWEIGGMRVDATLLIRQHARWSGRDLFFEMHGGKEFADYQGRERIDFLQNDTLYSCFVKEGDFLIWKEGRWHRPHLHEETAAYPLISVAKIEEKMMMLELWDTEGRTKLPLHILKTKSHELVPDLSSEFKFVGAKTWTQFIVECRNQRLILRSDDWLILTADGWTKMTTAEQVDDYVEQRLQGPLLVLDKLTKKEGKQILQGHLFSSTRSDVTEIELQPDCLHAPIATHVESSEAQP